MVIAYRTEHGLVTGRVCHGEVEVAAGPGFEGLSWLGRWRYGLREVVGEDVEEPAERPHRRLAASENCR